VALPFLRTQRTLSFSFSIFSPKRANWGKFLPVAHRALVVGFSPNVECLGLELLLYLSCVVGWYCVVFHKFVRVILQGRRQRGIMLTVLPVRWSAR
jgi:hypothetical protein